MKYEGMWNEFIFQKYSPLIKINRKKLKNELNVKIANNKKYEYNLSEILFDLEQNEKLNDKVEKIHKYIKQNDFKTLNELDKSLRILDKKDPVKYDYALFGLGVFEGF